jgi:hypothetical protein
MADELFDQLVGAAFKSAQVSSHQQSAPRSTMPAKAGRGKSSATIRLRTQARRILDETPWAMTLRQLYYALVSAGVIDKTEADYGRLKRVMKDAREDGIVPWEWLVDNTRSVISNRTWDSLSGLLEDSAKMYRADLMRQQNVAIQLWAESDSIGSVASQVALKYAVPTFIGRGYSARGYLWQAAKDAVEAHAGGKLVHILHVGDHDPSGVDIFRDVEETLRLYCSAIQYGVSVTMARRMVTMTGDDGTWWLDVERLALTPEQIEDYQLPMRPLKASDKRARNFKGRGSVEVEALPVDELLAIVEAAITSKIDMVQLEKSRTEEQMAREVMERIAAKPIETLEAA